MQTEASGTAGTPGADRHAIKLSGLPLSGTQHVLRETDRHGSGSKRSAWRVVRGLCRSSDGREGERGGEREGGREGEREREGGGRKKEREGGRREEGGRGTNRLCWLFGSLSIRCMCACVTDYSV